MDSKTLLQEILSNLKRIEDNRKVKELKLSKDFDEAVKSIEYSMQRLVTDNVEFARSLKQKSSELILKIESIKEAAIPKSLSDELKLFLKYCKMSVYEFTDKIKDVRKAYRAYLWGMITFLVLGGTYRMEFAVSAIVLAFPIILAMGGLRRRRSMGLMLAYATIPLPLVIFVMILTYALYAVTRVEEVGFIASAYGVSLETAFLILTIVLIASASGLILLSYSLKKLVENRHAFF
ncbi:MAG: alpha-glucosidase [Thermosphaera sp.]